MIKIRRPLRLLGVIVASVILLFFGYLSALAFPEPFFPYRVTYKHLSLYSRSELPKNVEDILQRTDGLLSQSELYDPNLDARIFVCDSYNLFWFYTGGQSHVFATCFPGTTQLIFVPKADYEHDKLLFEPDGPEDKRERHLTNTLAHEVTHLYLGEYLGFWKQENLPGWIKEGYCEYVGQGDAIDPNEGIRALLEGKTQMRGLYYFRSRRMMQLLIDTRGLSVKQILSAPPKESDVYAELLVSLRHRATFPQ